MKVPFDEVKDYQRMGWNYLGLDHENPRIANVEKSIGVPIDFDRIIYKFPVIWEVDSHGWIVLDKYGNMKILATNHGKIYEEDPMFLHDRLMYYQELLLQTQEAIKILKNLS